MLPDSCKKNQNELMLHEDSGCSKMQAALMPAFTIVALHQRPAFCDMGHARCQNFVQ